MSNAVTVAAGDTINIFQELPTLEQVFIIGMRIKTVSSNETANGITSAIVCDVFEDYANYFGFIRGGGNAADYWRPVATETYSVTGYRNRSNDFSGSTFNCDLNLFARPNQNIEYTQDTSVVANTITMNLNANGGFMSVGF